MLCFAALGAGNGALFQLVPLRWPSTTAVAGSMIGEIGALGGGLVPNAMGIVASSTSATTSRGFCCSPSCRSSMLGDACASCRSAGRVPGRRKVGGRARPRRTPSAGQPSQPHDEQRVEKQRDDQRELPQRRRIARHERRRQRRSQRSRSASLESESELLSRFKAFLAIARDRLQAMWSSRSAHRDGAGTAPRGPVGTAPFGRVRSRHTANVPSANGKE